MKEPIIILIVLFILIGLAYGPIKNGSLNLKTNANNTSSSIGTASQNSKPSTNKNTEESIKSAEENIKNIEENVNQAAEESKRSPYYGKIRTSGISGLYSNNPDRQYIYLSTNLDKNETIKITGWYLKSEVTGYYVIIGKAALLPFPFTNTESDVILERGDRVYLTKGFSPIGISFRTNECTGYFEENRAFYPSLSLECPRPSDEKLPVFSSDYDANDECLNTIERIPRCSTVDSEFIRDLPDTVPLACKTYMTTQINYNTCVALHFSDTDFPGNEYRLYLNKFGPLWRQTHDKIDLYDENGLVVDTISY
jgi:hypothetical protein